MKFTICCSVQDEASVMVASKNIESVSKISAEDTARRFFRANNIKMANVIKTQVSETFAQWSVMINTSTDVEEKVFEPKVEKVIAPKVSYSEIRGYTEILWDRWQDEREHEDFSDYVAAAKVTVEKIEGATFISLTRRPFILKFSHNNDIHSIVVNARAVTHTTEQGV